MKVIVAGSRGITKQAVVDFALGQFPQRITEVISGTARGVDILGEQWARKMCIPVKRFPADWDRYGKSAGYRRNEQMAAYADALVAVWDGESRGTKHMIDIMKRAGKMVVVFNQGGA